MEVDELTTFESSIIRARPDPSKADSLFLYYLFSSPYGRYLLSTIRRQVAVAGITGSDLVQLEIPLPPLLEQRAIAHILGTLDDKIELNRKMNQTLEAIARAIFKSWFVDFDPVIDNALAAGKPIPEEFAERAARRAQLTHEESPLPENIRRLFPDEFQDSELGPIPKGWEIKPFSELVEINPKRQLKKGQGAMYVDMASLPAFGSQLQIKPHKREYKSGSRFQNGDVLFARITPCLENGKTVLVDFLEEGEIAWGSTEFFVFAPKFVGSYFIYCASRYKDFRDHAIASMTGTSGRQRVSKEALRQFPMPTPTKALLDAFEKTVRPLFIMQRFNTDGSCSLKQLRDSLLPRLLSGELRLVSPEGGDNPYE
jgi:type I restriction enzyme S subunit